MSGEQLGGKAHTLSRLGSQMPCSPSIFCCKAHDREGERGMCGERDLNCACVLTFDLLNLLIADSSPQNSKHWLISSRSRLAGPGTDSETQFPALSPVLPQAPSPDLLTHRHRVPSFSNDRALASLLFTFSFHSASFFFISLTIGSFQAVFAWLQFVLAFFPNRNSVPHLSLDVV